MAGIPARLAEYAHYTDERLIENLPQPQGPDARLVEAMRYSVMAGGKRFRPYLVFRSAEICGADREVAVHAACAVECLHTYSLIHDDLPAMDDDELRRGKPTCHVQFDEATAILAGDALLTYAFELLVSADIPDTAKVNCVRSLATRSGYAGMVGGQMADTVAENHEPDSLLMDYIHSHKTGDLITCSCELGAFCAGATEQQFNSLRQFGRYCGLAFQVSDDICDHISTSEEMGKEVGKDDDAGKQNAVRVHGMAKARQIVTDSAQKASEALKSFGNGAEDLRQLVSWLRERRS